jgi:hypothetical protein
MTPSRSGSGPRSPRNRPLAAVVGGLIGGVIGLLVGAGVYLLITPVLEASGGLLRELQGLSWNLVPGLAVVGAISGVLIALRPRVGR